MIKKITINCPECSKEFVTLKRRPSKYCLKCRNKIYQKEYFAQKKEIDPEWNQKRNAQNLMYAQSTRTRLRKARIRLDAMLVQVEKQRQRIKNIEMEVKNGK